MTNICEWRKRRQVMHMIRSYLTHELEQISMRKVVGETAISGHGCFPCNQIAHLNER
jgi:hypothetical protein